MKLVPGTENNVATLAHIARLASTAGASVLAGRGAGPLTAGPDTKSAAGDWVTDFDRGAERAVREFLGMVRPADALTGEEYPESGPGTSGYRWSIDPLDGTANFVRGIVYYATSVAVFGPGPDGEERWLAGAVTAPALGLQYWAGAGLGAYRRPWAAESLATEPPATEFLAAEPSAAHLPGSEPQESGPGAGEPGTAASGTAALGTATLGTSAPGAPGLGEGDTRLSGPDPEADGALLATGFGYDAQRRQVQADALVKLLPAYANVRRLGSAALDLCLVADGTLDAYAELGTAEWDWAAGALIAEEAGAPVGRPDTYPGWQWAGRVDPSALR